MGHLKNNHKLKALILPIALFVWLISPAFYWAWQGSAPIRSTFLPPLSLGQRLLLAPHLIMEQIAFWLWPFGREPLVLSIHPGEVMRLGLFYWLILVLALRFAWRLRLMEPSILWGLVVSIVALIPFSGIIPSWVQAFDSWPLLFGGVGLAVAVASLLVRASQRVRKSEPAPSGPAKVRRLSWQLVMVAMLIWIGALSLNLIRVVGQTWPDRLSAITVSESSDVVVAVEVARSLAQSNQLDQAESLILRCGQAMPWYPEIPLVKAEILIARDQPEAAEVHLQRARDLIKSGMATGEIPPANAPK